MEETEPERRDRREDDRPLDVMREMPVLEELGDEHEARRDVDPVDAMVRGVREVRGVPQVRWVPQVRRVHAVLQDRCADSAGAGSGG